MRSLGYIGAFLGGAIAGAAIGVLMAPEKGKDTRARLAKTIGEFCEKHDIKLSRHEMNDIISEVEEAAMNDE